MKRRHFGWMYLSALATLSGLACSNASGTDEHSGALQGRFIRGTADFDDGHSEKWYYLEDANKKQFRLRFQDTPQIALGSQVAIYGSVNGGEIFVDDYELLESAATAWVSRANSSTRRRHSVDPDPLDPVQRVLWVSLESSFTADDADAFINQQYEGIAKYYSIASFGIWTTEILALQYAPAVGGCDTSALAEGAEQSAKDAGIDVDSYQQLQWMAPKNAGCGASFGLDGHTPLRTDMPRGKFEHTSYVTSATCNLVNQEIGHNYGLSHSHFCPNADTPTKDCSSFSEYGDPFTAMAGGCGAFNAWEKLQMNWYGECNVIKAEGNAAYELAPTHVPCNGPQVIMLAADMGSDAQRYYYLEYRKSNENDDTNGVLVHYASDPEVGGWDGCDWGGPDCPYTWLVDVAGGGSAKQAFLDTGAEWKSPQGVTIKVESLGETAKIQIDGLTGTGAKCYPDDKVLDDLVPNCMGTGGTGGSGGMGGAGGAGAGGASGAGGSAGAGGTAGSGAVGGSAGSAGTGASGGVGANGGSGGQSGSGGAGGVGGSGAVGGLGVGGAAGSPSGGSAGTTNGTSDEGGCSCRVTSASPRSGSVTLLGLLLAAGLRWRGRQQRRLRK